MVLDDYLEQDIPLKPLLKILGLPRSSYYYQPTGTKAGKRKAQVFYKDGTPVSKDVLIADIKDLLSQEFVDYGSFKTYVHLKNELSYAIGSTRTYQIMKENKLLKFQRNKQKRKNRNWRSEEHTSELQSRPHLVCRLLLEKKKKKKNNTKNYNKTYI